MQEATTYKMDKRTGRTPRELKRDVPRTEPLLLPLGFSLGRTRSCIPGDKRCNWNQSPIDVVRFEIALTQSIET